MHVRVKEELRECETWGWSGPTLEERTFVPQSDWGKVQRVAIVYALIYAATLAAAIGMGSILPLMVIGLPRIYGAWHHVTTGMMQHGGATYAIYHAPDGGFFATAGLCEHATVQLCDGLVMGHLIDCPKHNGPFDDRTGEAKRVRLCGLALLSGQGRRR